MLWLHHHDQVKRGGRTTLLGELAGENDPEIPDPPVTEFVDGEAAEEMLGRQVEKSFGERLRRVATRSEADYVDITARREDRLDGLKSPG